MFDAPQTLGYTQRILRHMQDLAQAEWVSEPATLPRKVFVAESRLKQDVAKMDVPVINRRDRGSL